ncbi:branched-chain amino acid ABC transporter permease [Azospirillum brasilense]|uniref:Branched-chain amino acid ABC transporter permease n=2 Tax=Azospirillum TaxID=191 RepID=A0A0P0ELW6_AZOBR|nr:MULTISPECIES: branched-chain amino acid ABC transporter permease [Azospirillum]ALJ38946.1 ABC transporter permease [Azospirillum brasilense]MDW7557382.1 branched-chain amino acid ABC transporter permease [Azospirillum brasilense]MDW7597051.1 branched-chain amino acid ABC transporter permease [Azospirillum brasilense]MDW7632132.1 branched-chain amino acid ABC transporter permease [Azospirillum brasilense]MDX5950655.1 branched-chain amino acid ABC transporter permease [Azospirillum brasilense
MTTRLLPWLFVLVMAVGPLWLGDQYILYVLTSTGIFIIGAMSLNLLLGYTGQLSLGHIAFFGIGAYTSALLSLGFDLDLGGAEPFVLGPQPVWVAFLGGILVAALFGFLIGKLAFRVRGAYFVIVTISFAQVMRMVALNWVDLTEGPMALNNIPPLSVWLPWDGVIPLYKKEYNYLLVLAVAVVCFLVIQRLVQSRVGRALVALRENESLARSVGIDVTRYLVVATVIAAGMAGAAGGLYTHYIRIVDPDVFMFIYTVTMVIMVVTGGKGTLAGPIVGGLAFGILPEVLREVARPEVQWIIYGVAMIVVVFFLPQGIVPAVKNWFAGRRKRVAGTALGLRKETSA